MMSVGSDCSSAAREMANGYKAFFNKTSSLLAVLFSVKRINEPDEKGVDVGVGVKIGLGDDMEVDDREGGMGNG